MATFVNMKEKTDGKATFLLVAIDAFTKKAFVRPLATKSANDVLQVFSEMYAKEIKKIDALVSDLGKKYILIIYY